MYFGGKYELLFLESESDFRCYVLGSVRGIDEDKRFCSDKILGLR